MSSRLLDIPNARSSHSLPTPRGGGLAIVIASTVGLIFLATTGAVDAAVGFAVIGGGLLTAAVGFIDDRGSLSIRVRIIAHCGAAAWALLVLGGLPPIRVGDAVVDLGVSGDLLAAVGIVWSLNLFNFMDGIDGIAATEAAFVAAAGAGMCLIGGASPAVPYVALVVASASLGFLVWNWPPARIFMGDVGSGYLGYVLAILAIAGSRESPVVLIAWLILGGAFFVDATATLMRRILRGQRPYEAHRTHAYQWLARRWASHRRVTVAVILINLIWLLPCALLAMIYRSFAWWILAVALTPIVIVAIAAGAGRCEATLSSRKSS